MVDDRANVIVTGFMGTGKTTVGRIVAARLDYRFVDTDDLIERDHGPIPELFEHEGEARFRELERAVARDLAGRRGLVIATGGGLMLDEENITALAATGTVVCLTAGVDAIIDRTIARRGRVRPLLAGDDPRSRVEELLAARAPAYERFVQVDTNESTPDQVADAIIDLVTGRDRDRLDGR